MYLDANDMHWIIMAFFLSTLKDYRTFLDNRTFFIELLVIFRVKPAKLPNLSVRQFAVCSPVKSGRPQIC